MAGTVDTLARDVCAALVARAYFEAKKLIQSATVRRSLKSAMEPVASRGKVFVPQWWAVYYHDGHGTVKARPGRFLVFFERIEDDPRRANNPERAAQQRPLSLSKAQFRALRRSGKLIMSKTAKATRARPFFTRLARIMPAIASTIAPRMTSVAVRDMLAQSGLDRLLITSRLTLF